MDNYLDDIVDSVVEKYHWYRHTLFMSKSLHLPVYINKLRVQSKTFEVDIPLLRTAAEIPLDDLIPFEYVSHQFVHANGNIYLVNQIPKKTYKKGLEAYKLDIRRVVGSDEAGVLKLKTVNHETASQPFSALVTAIHLNNYPKRKLSHVFLAVEKYGSAIVNKSLCAIQGYSDEVGKMNIELYYRTNFVGRIKYEWQGEDFAVLQCPKSMVFLKEFLEESIDGLKFEWV